MSNVAAVDPLLERVFNLLSERDEVRSVAAAEWAGILKTAQAHSVAPLLSQRLLASKTAEAVPPETQVELRGIAERTMHRNMRRVRDFARAASALQDRQIPVIALKGMHLLPLVYGSLGARAMVDIDLMVPASRLAAAGETVQQLGYRPWRPYRVSDAGVPFTAHHIPGFVKDGLSTIEVHWHIAPPPASPNIPAELWSRAKPVRIGGVDVYVFAAEDLLLHVASHGMYNHHFEHAVRASCDIAEIVRTQALDWDAVVERAVRWKIAAGTYVVLRLAQDRLAAGIPAAVLSALRPAGFDERMLALALRGEVERHSVDRVRHSRGVLAKMRVARDVLFIDRNRIADQYNMSRSSPLVYGLYLRRAVHLMSRWREVIGAYQADGGVTSDSAAIDAFLMGSR